MNHDTGVGKSLNRPRCLQDAYNNIDKHFSFIGQGHCRLQIKRNITKYTYMIATSAIHTTCTVFHSGIQTQKVGKP